MGAPTEGPRLGPVGAHPVERSTTRSLAGSVLENSEDHYIRLTGRRLCTIGHPHAPKLCGVAFIACRRGALASGQIPSCQTRIPAHLQTLPPDVRQHRHRDRQRPDGAIDPLGEVARSSVPAPVCHGADAALARPDLLKRPLVQNSTDILAAVLSGCCADESELEPVAIG